MYLKRLSMNFDAARSASHSVKCVTLNVRSEVCYGVSAFAATEESDAWVLATKMDVRRRYYRITSAEVAGFRLLPTFTAPHWTVMFSGPDGPEYQAFLDALGDLRENPYWKRTAGRRPR